MLLKLYCSFYFERFPWINNAWCCCCLLKLTSTLKHPVKNLSIKTYWRNFSNTFDISRCDREDAALDFFCFSNIENLWRWRETKNAMHIPKNPQDITLKKCTTAGQPPPPYRCDDSTSHRITCVTTVYWLSLAAHHWLSEKLTMCWIISRSLHY